MNSINNDMVNDLSKINIQQDSNMKDEEDENKNNEF